MSDGKSMRAPNVGIIYLVGDRLWIETTPVAQAMNVGDYAFHEHDHQGYWRLLVKAGVVPNSEYERYPRGRVSYNKKNGIFTFLADRCILREKKLVNAILSLMHVPARGTETGTDSLYRCVRCLGRSR